MPQEFVSTTIRAQIRADIKTAFPGIEVIFGSKPTEVLTAEDYPCAYIYLMNFTSGAGTPDMNARAIGEVAQNYVYEIALQELWPTDTDVTVEDRKEQIADTLLQQLTSDLVYAGVGIRRYVEAVDFMETDMDPTRRVMDVSLRFSILTMQPYV